MTILISVRQNNVRLQPFLAVWMTFLLLFVPNMTASINGNFIVSLYFYGLSTATNYMCIMSFHLRYHSDYFGPHSKQLLQIRAYYDKNYHKVFLLI
jgi:hypothetical protein